MKKSLLMLPLLLLLGCAEKQGVFFKNLKDGDKVTSPVKIEFGLSGMELHPAGTKKECQTCGHHHIIVDHGPVPKGQPVEDNPKKGYYHYGKAQTSATIELPPGKHKLTMQFADHAHVSYGQAMAETITIEVIEKKADKK